MTLRLLLLILLFSGVIMLGVGFILAKRKYKDSKYWFKPVVSAILDVSNDLPSALVRAGILLTLISGSLLIIELVA